MDATVPADVARAKASVAWPEKNERLSAVVGWTFFSVERRACTSGLSRANTNLLIWFTLTAITADSATTSVSAGSSDNRSSCHATKAPTPKPASGARPKLKTLLKVSAFPVSRQRQADRTETSKELI